MRAAPPIALLALLVCASCGPPIASNSAGIIGGTEGESFPGVGAILAKGTSSQGDFGALVCTGALIAPDVVLTAAHCLEGASLELFFTQASDVSTFSATLELPADAVPARGRKKHPDFLFAPMERPVGLGNYHDVGLLFLAQPLETPSVVIVDADGAGYVEERAEVLLAGYGVTEPNGTESGVLLSATSFINEVGDFEMQIGDAPPTPQKCHGDSGGPSFIRVDDGFEPDLRVLGVTSREYDATQCEKGGVDTRVDRYFDWIVEEMIVACKDSTRVACSLGVGPATPTPKETPDAGLPESAMDAGMSSEPDEGGCSSVRASSETPLASLSILLGFGLFAWLRRRSAERPPRSSRCCR